MVAERPFRTMTCYSHLTKRSTANDGKAGVLFWSGTSEMRQLPPQYSIKSLRNRKTRASFPRLLHRAVVRHFRNASMLFL